MTDLTVKDVLKLAAAPLESVAVNVNVSVGPFQFSFGMLMEAMFDLSIEAFN